MESVVEHSGERVRVPDEQHLRVARGHRPFDGVEDFRFDARCLVNHEEDVSLVETLESLFNVGRETEGEPALGEVESGRGNASPDQLRVVGDVWP